MVLMKELIGEYAHLWEDKGRIYSLAQGVVYWEPPESCQEALINELSSSSKEKNNVLHTYGPAQGTPALVSAIQTKIQTENALMNHDVMVTVGANQAYMNIVLTTLNENSKAIVFAPYYFNHVMALQMCCGKDSVVVGPTTEDGIPDLNWLQNTLDKNSDMTIDMVTIVNPGNPTGVSLSKEDHLQPIVDLCEAHGCWLVLDCTYEYFTQEEEKVATFPESSNVIHIFSFSKSYSLAGYRCGYLCLSHHEKHIELLKNMLKVQDTVAIAPPRISQIAALGALNAGTDWVKRKYATLDTSRDLILDSVSPLKRRTIGGSGAMYIMAQLPETTTDDIEVCRLLVKEHGIAIIPGSYCGAPGWIRVCYANLEPTTECVKAAARLKAGLQEIVTNGGGGVV